LGSEVIIIEQAKQLLNREDIEVSDEIVKHFHTEGINLLLEHTAKEFTFENNEKHLLADYKGVSVKIMFDQVLVALGRTANIKNYGVEEMDITLSATKTIATNAFQETNYPNIYACGDVTGPYQFTHVAAHQAWYATVNALFGQFKKFRTDYTVIPWATFTDPEIARVGINELEAKATSISYEKTTYNIGDLDRAITDGEAHGFVKVLTQPGTDKILGVTIVGEHAADIIAEFVLAMKYGLGLNKILNTIHIYPTFAEANKYTAGVWKKAHAPYFLTGWLDCFHKWRRH
jgi:Pyruvate/2-oxoglutarate dehydrogenase complex, dihydrolipoamide dehydrogenase (E3) component, and related enzymes